MAVTLRIARKTEPTRISTLLVLLRDVTAYYFILTKRDIEIISACSASWFIRISVTLGSDNQMSSMLSQPLVGILLYR